MAEELSPQAPPHPDSVSAPDNPQPFEPTWTPTHPDVAVVSESSDDAQDRKPLPFNVVGIGVSAGAVEALIELFSHLASDTGMAFIVVLHVPSGQETQLREI